jgi:hypothetical protein
VNAAARFDAANHQIAVLQLGLSYDGAKMLHFKHALRRAC